MVKCPVCDSEKNFERIGVHWGSTACEHPYPTRQQRELFKGIWLAGGSIQWQHENPLIQKSSTNKSWLEWVAEIAGIWSSSIRPQKRRGSFDSLEALTSREIDRASESRRYQWTGVSCPWLDNLVDRSVPDAIDSLSPLSASVLTVFRGSLIGSNLSISHREVDALAALLRDRGFDPSVNRREGRAGAVRLSLEDSLVFYDWCRDWLPGPAEKLNVDYQYPWRNPHRLRELYLDADMTTAEVAEELDTHANQIGVWLRRYGIRKENPKVQYPELLDRNWLSRALEEADSMQEIADDIGCGRPTVSRYVNHVHDLK